MTPAHELRPLSKRLSDVRLSQRRIRAIVDALVGLATSGPWTMDDAYEVAYDAATDAQCCNGSEESLIGREAQIREAVS